MLHRKSFDMLRSVRLSVDLHKSDSGDTLPFLYTFMSGKVCAEQQGEVGRLRLSQLQRVDAMPCQC